MKAAIALSVALATPAAAGSLVIVGGGLKPENADIYRAFIDRVAAGGVIAIVPSASGKPHASADDFAANLVRYGVARAHIVTVALAEIDDPATGIDEAGWAKNGRNRIEIAKIAQAGGIWFTGGDQARTMRVLRGTPMLKTVRARLKAGAVIGGTSAGAAIMGSEMIYCGDPLSVSAQARASRNLNDCAVEDGRPEPVVIGSGLGLLPGAIVDQHFSERRRLSRLQLALRKAHRLKGVGIDENTALVVDLDAKTASVLGSGSVTYVASDGWPRRFASGDQLSVPLFGSKLRALEP